MTNIILNPGFDDVALTPWVNYTDGSAVFTADIVSPYSGTKCAKYAITTVGTNSQMYQLDVLPVVASTNYRLSFAAYSSGGRDMTVGASKKVSPFTVYLAPYQPNLSTAWQFFSTDIISSAGAGSDSSFFFLFSGLANNGDIYYIDQVKLEKVKEIEPKFFTLF